MPAATYGDIFNAQATPQSEALPGTNQVPNSAGGYVYPVDDFVRTERFLVLGTEGGSYYAKERPLTIENARAVKRAVEADGKRVVDLIVAVSEAGRAPKNDPALFALAIAASYGSDEVRAYALANLSKVARIGTHLFHFARYVDAMRGWGRGLRKAIASWYVDRHPKSLAVQLVKYQSRDGWSHRDLLRLGHPKPEFPDSQSLFHWATKGWESVGDEPHPNPNLQLVWAYERAKRATADAEVAELIKSYGLTHEMVPTQFKASPAVWGALLEEIPITALVRNLATLTRVGLIGNGTGNRTAEVVDKLLNQEALKQGRAHPLALLVALKTYESGKGARGQHRWDPHPKIVDALNDAFYLSFGNVEPTGKRLLLALDVSGSMTWSEIAGMPGITPRTASAALALVTASVEPNCTIVAFTGGLKANAGLTRLAFSSKQRLDDVVRKIDALPPGPTDCALPALGALERKEPFDGIAIYTDSETWAGKAHPSQALKRYRKAMGLATKQVVVGMVSNGFTIADPGDAGQLDVVGFDTATPALMADFFSW